MTRSTSRARFIRRTARHPLATVRTATEQPLKVLILAIDTLPSRIRIGLLSMADRVARSSLRRRGPHVTAATVHVVALRSIGRPAEVRSEMLRLAADATPRLRARLARIALALDDPRLADAVMAPTREEHDDPTTAALRAEIDYRLGRYASAMARLGSGGTTGRGRDVLRRTTSELEVLDPAWRPALGPPTPLRDRTPGRVLHLLTNSLPYREAGYTVRSQSVARCQIAVGLDPHMATRAGFPATEGVWRARPQDDIDGVSYHRLRPDMDPQAGPGEMATATANAAVPLITTLRPSLLQPTTNYLNAQVALALGARFGLPVVYEVRGFLEETWLSRMGSAGADSDRYLAARAVETACMRAADAVVTLSESMRADILARGGISPDAVVVVPNGVDVERFVPGPRDDALAASLGIGTDEPVVGYISSFTAYEGIDHLIRAAAILRERGRGVRLLLVGDGDARASLEATTREAGLDDGSVIFTGRVPYTDILRYYRTIDVFVVPRTNDRVSRLVTPLKPYEAMAMERAVVVSAVDALLEIVEEDVTGRSFLAEDPTSLADAIEPLLDDPAARRRLGEAARAWVAANRTWGHNGRRYLELYRRLGIA